MKKVLLYYKYTPIENPQSLCEAQTVLCKRLNITGRILIADEGINGTVHGTNVALDQYKTETSKYPGLNDIQWKISRCDTDAFPRLRVAVRDEIVSLGLKKSSRDVNLQNKAEYIEPEELLTLYENNEDFVIIDARNEYESRIGMFKNAIAPDIENFREFPEFVESIRHLKNKQIVTYCTGGVRCEKASAFMKEQGFKDVRQLHGGIHSYSDRTGGKHFGGEMYVFDKRVNIPVNSVDPYITGTCHHCGIYVTRYINCCNAKCNAQIICCVDCETKFGGGCTIECKQNSRFHSDIKN